MWVLPPRRPSLRWTAVLMKAYIWSWSRERSLMPKSQRYADTVRFFERFTSTIWWKPLFHLQRNYVMKGCFLCLSLYFVSFCVFLFILRPTISSTVLYMCCVLSLSQSSFRGVYKCLWPSCGKVLTSSVGIKRHIRVLHLGWVEILLILESVVCLLGMDIAWDLSILVVQVQIPKWSDLNQPLNYTSHEPCHGTQGYLFSNGTIFQLYFLSIKLNLSRGGRKTKFRINKNCLNNYSAKLLGMHDNYRDW